MSDCAPTRRIIIDAPLADFDKCLELAREAIRAGEEGDVWGYWSSTDAAFQAVIRHNKASVSVKASRKIVGPA